MVLYSIIVDSIQEVMLFQLALFVLLISYGASKENAVYQVSGIELIDLIRGFKPKEPLELKKVEGDQFNLPQGIYFTPDDDSLSPEEYKHLNYKGRDTKKV